MQTDVWTLEEVATYLRVHRTTVSKLLRSGQLRGRKVGKEWRIHKTDAEDFLRQPESRPSEKVSPSTA